MANPYSTGSYIPDLSPTINSFVDNLVRLKTHQEDIDMRGRQLQEGTRQHNISAFGTETPQPGMQTLDTQKLDLLKRNQGLDEQKQRQAAAATPQHNEYGAVAHAYKTNLLTEMGVKKDRQIMLDSKEGAKDPNVTNKFQYLRDKEKYPIYREEALEDMADDYVKKTTAKPGYEKTAEGQRQKGFIDMLQEDRTGDTVLSQFYGPTIEGMKREEENQKSVLLEQRQGFQNELLQSKFDQYKEMQGLKFQNAKELQDAKYVMIKDMKVAGAGADALGRKILQGGYMEILRDVDKQLREMNPLMFENEDAFRAAKIPLEEKRTDILTDLRDLSGIPGKKPAPGAKDLDEATAGAILKEAGGDKAKAREIAKKRGYKF
jgi:hypothetical protein